MKKLLLFLMATILLTGCSIFDLYTKKSIDDTPVDIIEGTPLLAFDEYKGFDINNVISLTILKYTEGGVAEEEVTDMSQIQSEYNSLSKITVTGVTQMACEDNTTIYRYNMNDGKKYAFEFECNWLVIGNKRYNFR